MGHCCFLFFFRDVLQVQKLVELEGIMGAKIKAEEESEGETIMGPGGEALRPPGINIIHFSNKSSLFLGGSEQQSPWESFILGGLWPLGKLEEHEGETEEPEVSTREQFEFNWACTWLELGGAPALAEDITQGLITQVFILSQPPPVLVCSSVLFLCPGL